MRACCLVQVLGISRPELTRIALLDPNLLTLTSANLGAKLALLSQELGWQREPLCAALLVSQRALACARALPARLHAHVP